MNSAKSTALLLVFALGCDEQQYVNPDTVALVITDEATQMQRVNRCHYIPVLAGSRIVFRYEVDDELKATLAITRDDVVVGFEPDGVAEPFVADATDFTESERLTAESPPDGYRVELVAGCTPDDEYR
jgi:hypothetical protein